MGITNTDFYAHQYKPLLTLLESPANGLLIADEVGLGKTIEAGLIWTELRARYDMRRLLVVCPAMLKEKWRDELSLRFGIDAQIVDAKTLHAELSRSSPYGDAKAWIASYQSLRPPKAWFNRRGEKPKNPSAREKLADSMDEQSESDPLLDLVVFDEAHYMRNPERPSNKLGELLRSVSDYVVLLSATPINLGNDDLFHLLKLCDPDSFKYPQNFAEMIAANQPLVRARDTALRRNGTAREIIEHIQEAADQSLLQGSRQIRALLENPPTEEKLVEKAYRSELADSLERVNLLGHVVTRTRKRDVHLARPKRQVTPEAVEMTDVERAFYEYVTQATREYAWSKGISDGFLLAMPQRQVCSCPAAMARAWLSMDESWIEDLEQVTEEDLDESLDECEGDISLSLRDFIRARRPPDLDLAAFEQNDSKFIRLHEVLKEFFAEQPGEKVILFTSFRSTADYLTERLNAQGISSRLIWGSSVVPKHEIIQEFREQPALRVLVSTEVASEGVDLQFCKVLVNYDLPWNPMRVEQRIGRIDRLGQTASVIHIWNLFYKGTIDERIISRLLQRLKIFEGALGEPEPVVGETIQRLEAQLLTRKLSPEEETAAIERAAQALENVRIRQEHLEQNAAQMIAHGGMLLERITAAQELSRRVTDEDLRIYVRDYLASRVPGHQYRERAGEDMVAEIQLPSAAAADLDDFCRRKGLVGQTQLGNGLARTCRFQNRVTGGNARHFETIHQFHPLIRFISHRLQEADESFYPVVAIRVSPTDVAPLARGTYVFFARRWVFEGVKQEEYLKPLACRLDNRQMVGEDEADRLVNAARLSGSDWLEATSLVDPQDAAAALEALELEMQVQFARARNRKQDENGDRATFQLNAVEKHLERRLVTLRGTLETHIALGRTSLARATQVQIDKLQAKLGTRKEQIVRQLKITADSPFVCAGLVQVGN